MNPCAPKSPLFSSRPAVGSSVSAALGSSVTFVPLKADGERRGGFRGGGLAKELGKNAVADAKPERALVFWKPRRLCLSARKVACPIVNDDELKNEAMVSLKSVSSKRYSSGSWRPQPQGIKIKLPSQHDLSLSLHFKNSHSVLQSRGQGSFNNVESGRPLQRRKTLASVARENTPQVPRSSSNVGFMARLRAPTDRTKLVLPANRKRAGSSFLPKAMGDISDDPPLEGETENETRNNRIGISNCEPKEFRAQIPTVIDHSIFLKGLNSQIAASSVIMHQLNPKNIKQLGSLQMIYLERADESSEKESANKDSYMVVKGDKVPSWFEEQQSHLRSRVSKEIVSMEGRKSSFKFVPRSKLAETADSRESRRVLVGDSRLAAKSEKKVQPYLRPEGISSRLRLSSVNRSSLALDTNIDLEKVWRASDAGRRIGIPFTSIKCIVK